MLISRKLQLHYSFPVYDVAPELSVRMSAAVQASKLNDQEKGDKKKLQTGIARIWKSLPRDQGDPEMVGNGVLVCDPSIQSKLGVNTQFSKYAILTSIKTLGGDDPLTSKTCDYEVEFCHVKESNFKNPRSSVKDIMYSSIPKGSLLFGVLDTRTVENSLKNCTDRAFNNIDQICIWKNGDDVWCHYVQGNSPFKVLYCQLKCARKLKCGDLVIDIDPTSLPDLPLGSLILNDQKEVLGVLGKGSDGKYVVNTVAAALNEAQGISCITNMYS